MLLHTWNLLFLPGTTRPSTQGPGKFPDVTIEIQFLGDMAGTPVYHVRALEWGTETVCFSLPAIVQQVEAANIFNYQTKDWKETDWWRSGYVTNQANPKKTK